MTRIPVLHMQFQDPRMTREAIVERLRLHKRSLMARKQGYQPKLKPDGTLDQQAWKTLLTDFPVAWEYGKRIDRWAKTISQRHEVVNGLSHLKTADRERLETLREGVGLAVVSTEHQADELAAKLHAEFPWMGAATEAVWNGMRNSVRRGDPGLRLPPILLDGPPGIGKSAWARHLGGLLGTVTTAVEATNENASFGLVGSQRAWSNATPGRVVNTILAHRIGNPVIIVDEVEKAGRTHSNRGVPYGLAEALLPLLEPVSSRSWNCPYFEVKFDLSFLIWVLTSNTCALLPEPLLSRCPPIRLHALTLDELEAFARRQGVRRGLSAISIDAIVEALHGVARPEQLSLRTVLRMIERGSSLEGGAWHLH
jgi:hypothetical protein